MAEDAPISLEEYLARQLGSDVVSSLPFREALACYRALHGKRRPYTGPAFELSPVAIRPARVGEGFEAELRGDSLINGEGGYWISIVGWGGTEDEARASLGVALVNLIEDAAAIATGGQR